MHVKNTWNGMMQEQCAYMHRALVASSYPAEGVDYFIAESDLRQKITNSKRTPTNRIKSQYKD